MTARSHDQVAMTHQTKINEFVVASFDRLLNTSSTNAIIISDLDEKPEAMDSQQCEIQENATFLIRCNQR